MASVIYGLLMAFATSLVPRIMVSLGATVLVGAGMAAIVRPMLDSAVASIQGLPGVSLQIFLLGGFGEAVGLIGGALLTRAALQTAGRVLGVRLNTGGTA